MKLPELLSIKGTASKADWWLITIVTAVIEAFALAGCLIAALANSPPLSYAAFAVSAVILHLALWATLAAAARRFRDLGYSPCFTSLYFIPYFGWLLVWIPCGFLPYTFPKRTKVLRRTVSESSTP
ncbi:MAG: DUF805 domain-containing protein [Akkermansiaceae bacterium]|nr:DUF805 domain-containing protein [Akkermansiaceae bacterium]